MADEYKDVIRVHDVEADFTSTRLKDKMFGFASDSMKFIARVGNNYKKAATEGTNTFYDSLSVGYTATPLTREKLDINGALIVGEASGDNNGTIQYTEGGFNFREGGEWKTLGSATVTTDASLTGDGTAGEPLSVVGLNGTNYKTTTFPLAGQGYTGIGYQLGENTGAGVFGVVDPANPNGYILGFAQLGDLSMGGSGTPYRIRNTYTNSYDHYMEGRLQVTHGIDIPSNQTYKINGVNIASKWSQESASVIKTNNYLRVTKQGADNAANSFTLSNDGSTWQLNAFQTGDAESYIKFPSAAIGTSFLFSNGIDISSGQTYKVNGVNIASKWTTVTNGISRDSAIFLREGPSPLHLSNYHGIYALTDGKLYSVNSAGTSRCLLSAWAQYTGFIQNDLINLTVYSPSGIDINGVRCANVPALEDRLNGQYSSFALTAISAQLQLCCIAEDATKIGTTFALRMRKDSGVRFEPFRVNQTGEIQINNTAEPIATPTNAAKIYASSGSLFTKGTDGVAVNLSKGGQNLTKTITIEAPTASEDITIYRTDVAITVNEVIAVSTGTSPSTTYQLKHGTDRDAAGTNLTTSAATTSKTTGNTATLSTAAIPANSWIWLETTAASGTSVILSIDIRYTID